MTPTSIDDYLERLHRELRQLGQVDSRLIDEVHDHLADAIDDGIRRGLTAEEASREAFERFGTPEFIARSSIREKTDMRNWLTAVSATLWRWKWWLIAPAIVMAVGTSVYSSYFLPLRYRSETVIQIMPTLVRSEGQARSAEAGEHLRQVTETALTRWQLEQLIRDLGLYQTERAREPLGDVVQRMRRDIGVVTKDASSQFVVSYQSQDPRLAMKTAERLAALFVEQNLRQASSNLETTSQFLDSQIGSLRMRLVEREGQLKEARAAGHFIPEADVIAYDVLRDMYKAILVRREEARTMEGIETRSAGLQFQITEPARLPERPVGPSHFGVTAAGTVLGLGLGLLLVGMRQRSTLSAA